MYLNVNRPRTGSQPREALSILRMELVLTKHSLEWKRKQKNIMGIAESLISIILSPTLCINCIVKFC